MVDDAVKEELEFMRKIQVYHEVSKWYLNVSGESHRHKMDLHQQKKRITSICSSDLLDTFAADIHETLDRAQCTCSSINEVHIKGKVHFATQTRAKAHTLGFGCTAHLQLQQVRSPKMLAPTTHSKTMSPKLDTMSRQPFCKLQQTQVHPGIG